MKTFTKDPDAALDYTFDWSEWLGDGEIISSNSVTVADGLTEDSVAASDTAVTVWISGGDAGKKYSITCKITTDNTPARVDQRSIKIIADDL